jgi:hypothetical protein
MTATCVFCKQEVDPSAHKCWSAPEDPRGFEYWVDGMQFFALVPSMSVYDMRRTTGADAHRACWQESPVEGYLNEKNSVDLRAKPRFMFIPNAYYGIAGIYPERSMDLL